MRINELRIAECDQIFNIFSLKAIKFALRSIHVKIIVKVMVT